MHVSKRLFELETETAFAILAKANKLQSEGKDIINLGIGQPDFPTPQNILEAAKKAINRRSSWIYTFKWHTSFKRSSF